ncbi:MAG: hypothetical protein LUH07_12675 [Lachnospiraceae bacterium]|nr:hypothetical protein [Lachnospiraceae bacterium]
MMNIVDRGEEFRKEKQEFLLEDVNNEGSRRRAEEMEKMLDEMEREVVM